MKKIILAMAIAATTVYTAGAQVRFGIKAGLNGYNFSGDDADDDYKTKIGLNGGGLVNIPVAENFSVQPEVLYSSEGSQYTQSPYTVKLNLTYINVPVLIQFNSSSGFYVEAGPQIGFLASAKRVDKGDDFEDEEDIKEVFKTTNISVAGGAGYRHSSGFGIGARYNFGLVNIVDDEDADIKTGGFQVGISYLFGGKTGGEAKKAVTKPGY